MSIRIQHCIVIVCDWCGGTGDDEDGGTVHFANLDEAQQWLGGEVDGGRDEHHWLMTPTEHVCPDCRRKRACALVGHPWADWQKVDVRGIPMMVRTCWDCMEREFAPLVEAGDA